MNRITTMAAPLALAMTCACDSARAQNIFFDAFSGDQLRPRWQQPPPGHWEHTVADSRLTVSGLFFPGVPGQPNTAGIEAEFTNFKIENQIVTTVLGWNFGEGRKLSVNLTGRQGLQVAFGYDEMGGMPVIFMERPGASPPLLTTPAPGPGVHNFRLELDSDGLFLYVNGSIALHWAKGTGQPISRVEVEFAALHGAAFSPLHVDLMRIVPSPATMIVLLAGWVIVVRERRR